MSENHIPADEPVARDAAREEQARRAGTAPGLEGEGGQYEEGDYGDAGVVGPAEVDPEEAQYPDGDYGEAGTTGTDRAEGAIREGLTDGQVNTTDQERGPLHG
ncbi:hypothetical protein [Pseudarthrobacter sulfonivorans]|uniref:hypothetical protein n=1 Tax=Pseudarthrobacter sulfonivorans TaxID=121292 RepID=UPI0021061CBC|nr:hypothetical protein [Pseudarthrobacter sulfonivorans]